MGFVTTERWVVERQSMPLPSFDRWGRLVDRLAAGALSGAVAGGLILALILSGEISVPRRGSVGRELTLLSLSAAATLAEGAAPASQAAATVATAPPPDVDTSAPAPAPAEWSVVSLPPRPAVAKTQPVPSSSPQDGKAAGVTGAGPSAGFDPYAFASLRQTPPEAGAPVPDVAALAELQAQITRSLGSSGSRVALRLTVEPDGSIGDVSVEGAIPAREQAVLLALLRQARLYPADQRRAGPTAATLQLLV